jgi:hypothetical protein
MVRTGIIDSVNRTLLALATGAGLLAAPAGAGAIPCLSGFVRGPGGAPVADADLDFNIAGTGQRIITPGDNTDAAGFYTVCVLPNVYDIAYAPPAGTRLLGRLVKGVVLTDENGLELSVELDEGQVATGLVLDEAGMPVPDVDIDVDDVAGGRIYTPGDNTAADGTFRVVVPAGLHRFRFEPPRGSRLRGAEVDSVDVTADADLAVTLEPGFLLRGGVADDAGQPAPDVDVDLRDALTGAKIYLANNATDAAGDYVTAAPAGTFELRYTPPRTAALVAVATAGFSVNGDVVRDQVLERGHRLEVTVLGTGDLPLAGADLDVKDAATGAKLFTPHDSADAAGLTVAVLRPGTYDIIIDAPPGASYAGAFVPGVEVTGDTQLTVRLNGAPRVTVTGRVVDERGEPVGGVVFGAHAALDGEEIRLANDRTAADGTFALDLPPVPVDLAVVGPAQSRLVPRRIESALATSDTSWADLVLGDGLLVEVAVTGTSGRAIAGADLDVFAAGDGSPVFTPDDDTDAGGLATLVLPAGAYRIVAAPPAGSGFAGGSAEDVEVTTDRTVTIALDVDTGGAGRAVLLPAWPNPFHDASTIALQMAAPSDANLDIYDVRGRLVRRLALPGLTEGRHTATWDGRTAAGTPAAAGVYFIRLDSPLGGDTQRITLVR